jgi:predicted ATPase
LLGLLWALLDGPHPLLLEEPELSLHPEVIRQIPLMMARLGRKLDRQILVSTHSADLLSDSGISMEEVLLLQPTLEDTKVQTAADDRQIQQLLKAGVPMSEAVLPRVAPLNGHQLSLFGD